MIFIPHCRSAEKLCFLQYKNKLKFYVKMICTCKNVIEVKLLILKVLKLNLKVPPNKRYFIILV